MKTQRIIPAIIPDSLEHLRERLLEVRRAVHRVQIDVIDGVYAPSSSWPYSGVERDAFEAIRREDDGLPYWQDFDFEIDMMVERPEERIDDWILAGAACLIIHVESTRELAAIVDVCHDRRVEVALALKPSTDPEVLAPYIEQVVFVQVMGSDRIGYHGVSLDEKALTLLRTLRTRWPELALGIDIGVSRDTIATIAHAGATRFAAGSAVFGAGTAIDSYHALEALAAEAVTKERS